MRARICAANWKMNKTNAETHAFMDRFLPLAAGIPENVEIVLCAPFTALLTLGAILFQQQGTDGRISLGAQNMHWLPSGAFTGEISAPMLLEIGVRYVILGHSERRQYFGETDEDVRRKTEAALESGLLPIVAVGEPLAIRDQRRHVEHVVAQTRAALSGLSAEALTKVTIAYEPIWAIGTGKNCDAGDANDIMHAIRTCMKGLEQVPVLYGGSVKADNIAAYTAQPDIDGGLVGGASLDPVGFAQLATAAA